MHTQRVKRARLRATIGAIMLLIALIYPLIHRPMAEHIFGQDPDVVILK